jgi:hypothetical protein
LPALEVFWWLTVGSGGGGREVVELDGWRCAQVCGVVVGERMAESSLVVIGVLRGELYVREDRSR